MSATIINNRLPVIIEVLEKTSWWRYNLRFGARKLSTKSQIELEVGALYYANIGSGDGVVAINGLQKRPNDAFIEGCEEILERIIQSGDSGILYEWLARRLALCDDAQSFDTLLGCLMALEKGIISLPFYYENLYCLAQIKANGDGLDFYLLFGSFAPVIAHIENACITEIISGYESLTNALVSVLKCKGRVAKIEPFFKGAKNILDFKG